MSYKYKIQNKAAFFLILYNMTVLLFKLKLFFFVCKGSVYAILLLSFEIVPHILTLNPTKRKVMENKLNKQ